MNINILLIITIAVLIIGAAGGWKQGLIEGAIGIVSCILGILVFVVTAKGIGSFMQKSYINVIMALILLLVIRIIHRIVRFVLNTFKLVRAIPIGRFADKLAGIVLGIAESIVVIWILFFLIGSFNIMGLNSWLMSQISESSILSIIYNSNYLIMIMQSI
jgi:uncharacterized membrane protein required for colicin V production